LDTIVDMPRFVLLYHVCPPGFQRPSHWDLMIEAEGALRTWSLAELPSGWQAAQLATAAVDANCPAAAAGDAVSAAQLADHRLAYLEFEGPLTGGRGQCRRIDRGTYTMESTSPQRLRCQLAGEIVRGRIELRQDVAESGEWTLTVDVPA
jgi:hypothetical protein